MIQYKITLAEDFRNDMRARLHVDGELPEYGQVWVWDMVYAQTMHAITDAEVKHWLGETLDLWAVNMSSKVHSPIDMIRLKEHDRIHDELLLKMPEGAKQEGQVIVSGEQGEMPQVEVHFEKNVTDTVRAGLVLALAQYFCEVNELFVKELSIHVLAFRKYYSDIKDSEHVESVEEAPLFAIQKALEYFNSIAQGTPQ